MSQFTSPLQTALLTVDDLKTQMRTVLKLHMARNGFTLSNLATAIGSTAARANRMLMPHSQHEVSLQAYVTAIATLGMDINMTVGADGSASLTIKPPATKISAANLLNKPHPDTALKSDLSPGVRVLMSATNKEAAGSNIVATVTAVGRIYIDVAPEGATSPKPVKFDGRTMLGTFDGTQYLLLLPDELKVATTPPAATPEADEATQGPSLGAETAPTVPAAAEGPTDADKGRPGDSTTVPGANDETMAEQQIDHTGSDMGAPASPRAANDEDDSSTTAA